jgi:hypothetical protein
MIDSTPAFLENVFATNCRGRGTGKQHTEETEANATFVGGEELEQESTSTSRITFGTACRWTLSTRILLLEWN